MRTLRVPQEISLTQEQQVLLQELEVKVEQTLLTVGARA